MKKFCTAFVLILALTGILCSCTATDNTPADTDAATTTTAAATTTTSISKTTSTTSSPIPTEVLCMPDRIEISVDAYEGAIYFDIQKSGDYQLEITTLYETFTLMLDDDTIRGLNSLYGKITDFSTTTEYGTTIGGDVTIWIGNETYCYWKGMANQPELDQYINALIDYVETNQ